MRTCVLYCDFRTRNHSRVPALKNPSLIQRYPLFPSSPLLKQTTIKVQSEIVNCYHSCIVGNNYNCTTCGDRLNLVISIAPSKYYTTILYCKLFVAVCFCALTQYTFRSVEHRAAFLLPKSQSGGQEVPRPTPSFAGSQHCGQRQRQDLPARLKHYQV